VRVKALGGVSYACLRGLLATQDTGARAIGLLFSNWTPLLNEHGCQGAGSTSRLRDAPVQHA
jgi:hypothetical protein